MRIAAVYTYPVKGCHRLEHERARVGTRGLTGDRRWLIVDPDGVGVTQRDTSRLVALRPQVTPGGLLLRAAGHPDLAVAEPLDGTPLGVRVFRSQQPVPARLAGQAAHAWLSALLDRPVRLTWQAEPASRPVDPEYARDGDTVSFADAYPLLVANAASLAALNDHLHETGDEPVPITRFRPNLVVEDAAPWAEDEWVGRRLRVGEVMLRAVKPCDRCVVTTIDQETGDKGRQPLHALAVHRRFPGGLMFGVNLIPDGPGEVRMGDQVQLLP